jgi:hypothetical protein
VVALLAVVSAVEQACCLGSYSDVLRAVVAGLPVAVGFVAALVLPAAWMVGTEPDYSGVG